MFNLKGYTVHEKTFSGKSFLLFKGNRLADNQAVLIKTPPSDFPKNAEVAFLQEDFEMTQNMPQGSVLQPLEIFQEGNKVNAVYQDFGGRPMREYLGDNNFFYLDTTKAIEVFIAIVKALGPLHQQGFIHKCINPAHILLHPSTNEVRLTGFGFSNLLSSTNRQTDVEVFDLENMLYYISPEQTERINVAVDQRSDIYSLGITFYECLTRVLPFRFSDTLGLIHAHIAIEPPDIKLQNSGIPNPLAAIIMKMITKNVNDRYQGAKGLLKDLEHCLELIRQGRSEEFFALGKNDISDVFHIPETLFGRAKELEILRNAFEKLEENKFATLFISGSAGSGKTNLVEHARRSVEYQDIYFLSGTYKNYNKSIPFSAIIAAVEDLIEQILASPNKNVEEWKLRLQEALGPQAQLMVNIIPELAWLIGAQPVAVTEVTADEAENRLKTTFLNFIQAFTKSDKGLVIFLDDLQLADAASIDFLRTILSNPANNRFLLITAYIDSLLSENQPLRELLSDFSENEAVTEIELKALQEEDLLRLISENFPSGSAEINGVIDILFLKTKGVPIFIREFLSRAYKEKGLYFNYPENCWQWDVQQLERLPISENVADLMLQKVQELSPQGLEVLKLAACQGARFDPLLLAFLSGQSMSQIYRELREPLSLGYVNPPQVNSFSDVLIDSTRLNTAENNSQYSFIHDRLHQTVYSLIEPQSKQQIHYKISQYLLENFGPKELDDNIFEVANHLYLGIGLLENEQEIDIAINTFAQVARKANAASSYQLGYDYISAVSQLITEEHWQKNHDPTFRIQLEFIENAFMSGNIANGLKVAEKILPKCKSEIEQAEIYQALCEGYVYREKYDESYEAGLKALEILGKKLPKKVNSFHVLVEIAKVNWMLRGKSYDDLLALPARTDRAASIMNRVYHRTLSIAINKSNELFAVISLRMLQIILKYGLGDLSFSGFVTYGSILSVGFGQYKKGYEFMDLAMRIGQQSNNILDIAGGQFGIAMNSFIARPVEECLGNFENAFQNFNLGGNVYYASSASFNIPMYLIYLGKPLKEIEHKVKGFRDYTKNVKHLDAYDLHRVYLFFLKAMQQDDFQKDFEAAGRLENYPHLTEVTTGYYYNVWLLFCFFCGQYEKGMELLPAAGESMNKQFYTLNFIEFHYIYPLLIGQVYETATANTQRIYRKKIRKALKLLKDRAKHAPRNFQHLYLTISGLWLKLVGKPQEALAEFEVALQIIPEGQLLHNRAILYELAGQVSLQSDQKKSETVYLEKAYQAFKEWGALASCARMIHQYPEALTTVNQFRATEIYETRKGAVDFKSVLKASQVLSSEIELSKLLSDLIRIAIENAGAQRGFLLIENNGKLIIEAEGTADNKIVKTKLGIPVEENSQQLSAAIVNYVFRTKKSIVLNDASNDEKFSKDFYIIQHQPKSITCQPILNQANLIGILYLENNLTTGAFTYERKEVLGLLSSQMAISIQNAQLYSNLEQTVKDRTAALLEQKEEAEKQKERAERSEKFKEQFLANMSHEIRTPMHAISGMTNILRRNEHLPAQNKYLDAIHQSADNLLVILNDILDLSKIEAGKIEIKYIPVNPQNVIDIVIDMLRVKADEKGLQLTCTIADDIPEQVMGDPTRLNQILINLVGNAIKFTDHGFVNISLEKIPQEQNLVLRFAVTDSGIGIPADKLQRIFESFQQVDDATTRKYQGTGLGLSISKQLVELQNGSIWVESEEKKGSTFFVDLPLLLVEDLPDASSASEEEELKKMAAALSGLKILLAEDNAFNVMVAVDDLNYYIDQVKIDVAENGNIALAKYQSEDYDLILMDIQMPEMNGRDASLKIRALEAANGIQNPIPIIAMTASLLKLEIDLCYAAGMTNYIPKPYKVEELISAIYAESEKAGLLN